MRPARRQHSKGRKRPRRWHRSTASSHRYYEALKRLAEAEARRAA